MSPRDQEVRAVPEEPSETPGLRHRFGRAARRALLVGGIVGLAAGGAAGAFAATTVTGATTASTVKHPGSATPVPGIGVAHSAPDLLPWPFLGNVLHSTYTVQTGPNAFATYQTQVGTASNITQNGLTVTSADGFSTSYMVTPTTIVDAQRDGIGSIAGGNEVSITATVTAGSGGSTVATATTIIDQTQVATPPCATPFFPPPGPPTGGVSSSGGSAGSATGGPARPAVVCRQEVRFGKASNVGESTITVTGPSGHATTYAVTSSTIVDARLTGVSSINSGDDVVVTARRTGSRGSASAPTAVSITDLTQVGVARCWWPPVAAPMTSPPGGAATPPFPQPVCPVPLRPLRGGLGMGVRVGHTSAGTARPLTGSGRVAPAVASAAL